uniref:Uncharacterized protein n=1 Tax=Rhizophora mucronata TaxID=61149 RepID=A0A2P2KB52_RHIMU
MVFILSQSKQSIENKEERSCILKIFMSISKEYLLLLALRTSS